MATRDIDQLALYHANPRRSDVNRLCESLLVHGQYRPIVVNKGTHTGRPREVLAGNHLLQALRELAAAEPTDERFEHLAVRVHQPGAAAWRKAIVHEIDVDDHAAARIVAVDNRTADLGSYDDDRLLELLRALPDLDGTGYTDLDLQALEDITAGAPDLDDLAAEAGHDEEPVAGLLSLKKIDPHTRRLWDTHRKGFADDDTALLRLLDDQVPA